MEHAFSFDIETCVEEKAGFRRYRWHLKAPGDPDLACQVTYATKREAVKEAEAALKRARDRGRLRP